MKSKLSDKKQNITGYRLRSLCFILFAFAILSPLCMAQEDATENVVLAQESVPQVPRGAMSSADPFSNYVSLYSDHKARRVGDIVTIIVTESTKASKSSATKTAKNSGSNGSLNDFFGLSGLPLEMGVDSSSDYSGSGSTTRSGSMEAKISALVKQILPNGSLMLEGNRQVVVNEDTQTITISGIVRPEDISSQNTVLSMYMADAKISYAGEGPIAQKPGIITRIIQTPFHWVAGIFRKIL